MTAVLPPERWRAGRLERLLLGQRGHLFPWAPVCLAVGIGLYFALRVEPSVPVLAGLAVAGAAGLLAQRWLGMVAGPLLAAVALVALGVALAGARAHQVAGPVLDFRYYGAVEGRIVGIDRSASDAVRLTLDQVVLERMAPAATPRRVRVSLHGDQGFVPLGPGDRVILTGHLGAPGGAVEPGGFDFQRHAWFLRLGAVGYTRNPVLRIAPSEGGQALFATRMWLSARVQRLLPGEAGAFAAAVMTGDRSGMGQGTLQALRDSNLAHLLAISGLHMGLLAGFVFGAARLTLLVIPWTRHRWPAKRLAAVAALLAATGYLALSGGNVATQRAFIMVAVALVAVLLNRRALSLRGVAMAALLVLCLRPEMLISPGFQMSFAATTALVAVFERYSHWQRGRRLPRWWGPVAGLVISSGVAGLATAPVGMAHFNQMAQYGLIANLVSVSVMGVLVVPFAVAAALLMPFGLDWLALAVMGLGLDWILFVATTVAGWEGAVRHVAAPGPWALPLIALGGLVLCLWQGAGRLAGAVPMIAGAALWAMAERPMALISDSGALVGVQTATGRALSRDKGSGFIANTWLENDGKGLSQPAAAALWPERQDRVAIHALGAFRVVHLQGKRATEGWRGCGPGDILVSSATLAVTGPCLRFDADSLRATGSVALWADKDGVQITTARARAGDRIWSSHPR